MSKKVNYDLLTDDQILALMYHEAILDAIDEVVDDMESFPDIEDILKQIKRDK